MNILTYATRIDLPPDGPPAFFRRSNGLSRRALTRVFALARSECHSRSSSSWLRFESVIGEHGIPVARALTFPRLTQECGGQYARRGQSLSHP